MDSKYIIGINELDSQHEGIEAICRTLQESTSDKDRWYGLVEDLYEKLRFHFFAEESIMRIFAYPEYQEHQRSHLAILKAVERLRDRNLTDAEIVALRDQPIQIILEQILSQDMRFAAFLTRNKERFGIQ